MGTHGLYISFPDNLTAYNETVWYVTIPNKKSTEYLSNYNAWKEAVESRDKAIQGAEFKYKKILAEQESGMSAAASAEIQKIDAEIRKNTIYAPFNGKVTNIEKKVGESAGTGERVISVLGQGALEVVLEVPELDISKLVLDSKIEITFDAFPGDSFEGTLRTINLRDTEVDGVPVYEAFVEIASDPKIKTGMSAYGTIKIAEKSAA